MRMMTPSQAVVHMHMRMQIHMHTHTHIWAEESQWATAEQETKCETVEWRESGAVPRT